DASFSCHTSSALQGLDQKINNQCPSVFISGWNLLGPEWQRVQRSGKLGLFTDKNVCAAFFIRVPHAPSPSASAHTSVVSPLLFIILTPNHSDKSSLPIVPRSIHRQECLCYIVHPWSGEAIRGPPSSR